MSLRTIAMAVVVVLIIFGSLFIRQRNSMRALRKENSILAERLTELQRDHNRVLPPTEMVTEDRRAELLRLREKAAQLHVQLAAAVPASVPGGSRKRDGGFTDDDLVTDVPKQAWTFAGYKTPKDALMSILSAQVLGDFNAFSNGFSPYGRSAFLDKKWTGKSEGEISADLVAQMQHIVGCHVVDTEGGFGGTRCDILVEFIWDNGTRTTDAIVMERDSPNEPEWKCSSEGTLLGARPR